MNWKKTIDVIEIPFRGTFARILVGAIFLLVAIVGGPFLIQGNALAQGLYGLITTAIATGIGVWASWNYSRSSDKERLTRYGLLAWRGLNSLQVKVTEQLGAQSIPEPTLHAWIMDIDGAKWAWQDLLRELFQLQDRLQGETDEVVQKYKEAIAASSSMEERSNLETRQVAELAQLAARAPLPIKLSEEVVCPKCETRMMARVGSASGDSGWPVCPNCQTRLAVFRQSDGT